jgi:hypothetical protein
VQEPVQDLSRNLEGIGVICKYIIRITLIGYSYLFLPRSRQRYFKEAHSHSAPVRDMFDNAIRSAVKGSFDALLQRSGVLWNEFHDTMNYPIQIFTGFTFKAEGQLVF